MFEITADDIALLNDEDLRTFVALLCESEMRKRGISPSCVTWGGQQTAPDGGLDVRVALPSKVEILGFIPRPDTGFQAKAEDITPAKVISEMQPKGILRSTIRELADKSGAYIIVSSKSSTSDSALDKRREAMAQAVKDLPNASALTLDFYDRRKLETWLRDHVGLTLWVRERIGRPLEGWSGYGAWSHDPGEPSNEYLLDDEVRVRTQAQKAKPGLSAIEGIRCIRDVLRNPKGVVRMVGLSGVGKTRLLQALFDDRVGEHSLDSALAAYTNLADGPKPNPASLATELINTGRRAILIVDNCPSDVHQRLSEICRSEKSILSLITVEYDIREDLSEGTEVFVLEPASIDLTEKLTRRRFSTLSPVDARKIAEFSGGNARIAIALASRIEKDESISQLSDLELFRRLFQQRQEPSERLFAAAQALSLVYSFHGENLSQDEKAELLPLGKLIGTTHQEMFKHSAELERRSLVQRRGPWRAVLPHAIANRLAAMALQNLSLDAIRECFIDGGNERLLRSFSRRLSYLNHSEQAKSIASEWLGSGGMLERPDNLNDLGFAIFNNVAPIAEEEVLAVIEKALTNESGGRNCWRYLRLIRSLAYDPAHFERCIAAIVKIAGSSSELDGERKEDKEVFASLFPILYSGTHATIAQRLKVIKSLLLSESSKEVMLGLEGLKAALQVSHFGPSWGDFEFGAHSRDYGWWPKTNADVNHWFNQVINLVEEIGCSDIPVAGKVRDLLASRFRGLWTVVGIHDQLIRVCKTIAGKLFWTAGWVAVRETSFYDSKGFDPATSARLAALEELLRPKDVVQKVRSIVFVEELIYTGLDSTYDGAHNVSQTVAEVESIACELGKVAAQDRESLDKLLPELVTTKTQQSWSFGKGLATGNEEHRQIWALLVTHLDAAPSTSRSPHVLRGFLNALQETDSQLVTSLLDDAVANEPLAYWYPVLQTAVGIDKEGVDRLIRSLEVGKAWIGMYRNLVAGGVSHPISGRDFNRLLKEIAARPDGLDVAIEILYMRISFEEGRKNSSPTELIEIGCELMRRLNFPRRSSNNDYRFGVVANHCLVGETGANAARQICQNLKDAILKYETYAFYHSDLLKTLFALQPLAALESLCGENQETLDNGLKILEQASQLAQKPFDGIPEADLLEWCDRQPESRYPSVASGVTPFRLSASGESRGSQWTGLALKLLEKAPDRAAVLKKFSEEFIPRTWSGSRTEIMEANVRLLDELAGYTDAPLVELIGKEKARLAKEIENEKVAQSIQSRTQPESWVDSKRYESFE